MLNKKIRNIVILGVLGLLFAAIGYWDISPERFLDQPTAAVDESQIDYYAINAKARQYLPDGGVQYDMTADKVEHLKATDVTLMTTPVLQMYRGSTFPWHVQSVRAEVSPGGDHVELIDSVRINRTDEKNRTTIITSSDFLIRPRRASPSRTHEHHQHHLDRNPRSAKSTPPPSQTRRC